MKKSKIKKFFQWYANQLKKNPNAFLTTGSFPINK